MFRNLQKGLIPEAGSEVALSCPDCRWVSPVVSVEDEPNGAWNAYARIMRDYRLHHSTNHWREPVRLVQEVKP